LIFCASNGPSFARAAVAEGWLYGARLPATVYADPWFVDQDWRRPNRRKYMTALARRRPVFATVLDWERESQLPEVLSWARQAALYVREAVVVVPKVVGGVARLPRAVEGKRVILGYSVPTSYGSSPVPLEEFHGWPVHLLGGSPQAQLRLYRLLRPHCEVTSADGNMVASRPGAGGSGRNKRGRRATGIS
jgi:hypothetical protein